jgi:hypothetical protein
MIDCKSLFRVCVEWNVEIYIYNIRILCGFLEIIYKFKIQWQ